MPRQIPFLLLTRPKQASHKVIRDLQSLNLRFEPIVSPLIGIDYLRNLPQIMPDTCLIFTSANGVRAYFDAGGSVQNIAYTVGRATDQVARDRGMHTRCAFGDASDLMDLIRNDAPTAPLLHICGEYTHGEIAATLLAAGFDASEQVMYTQPALPLTVCAQDVLLGSDPVIAPIYSPRTAQILAQHRLKAPLSVAALSETVAKACGPLHKTELRIAPRPESDLMLNIVADLIRDIAA